MIRHVLLPIVCLATASAAEKRIAVFVGLCDNATQGIVKVGAKIGDGDLPDDNLYWGCDDGLKAVFKRSGRWNLEKREVGTGDPRILDRLTFRHTARDAVRVAEAWRGSKLSECLAAFDAATVSGRHDLVAFISHNALMDTKIPAPADKAPQPVDAIMLSCLSETYFSGRLEATGTRPVLLTTRLMYPGSFLLHAALEPWLAGKNRSALREAAAGAYAKNQKIGKAAAAGVFAELE